MEKEDTTVIASKLAAQVLASRVSEATARPTAAEGREAAGYYRQIFKEIMRGLGTPVSEEE